MFKRLIAAVLLFAIAASCAAGFSACGDEAEKGIDYEKELQGFQWEFDYDEWTNEVVRIYGVEDVSVTEITVPDCVAAIGGETFQKCKNLTKIKIGSGVNSIAPGAFHGTAAYEAQANWENGALYLDNCLIETKESVSGNFQIREGTRLVANSVFRDRNLTGVSMPNSLQTICSGVFGAIHSLESVTLGSGVIYLGASAFDWCKNLKSVTFGGKLQTICGGAFRQCEALQSVVFPDSVQRIGRDAFSACGNLVSVTFGTGLEEIGDSAFAGAKISSVALPSGLKKIGELAFNGCQNLTTVSAGDEVTEFGGYVFQGTPFLEDSSHWSGGVLYLGNYCLRMQMEYMGRVTVKAGTRVIAGGAFGYCNRLTGVILPDSVVTVGGSAFGFCENLETVSLGKGVKTIGYAAFMGCNALKEIVIPDSVTTLKNQVFENCAALTKATIGNGVTAIDEHTFYRCAALEEVVLGNGVKEIGKEAFRECGNLKSVNFPNGLQKIGTYAFRDCVKLNDVEIPASLTQFEMGSFYNCASFSKVALPDSLTEIAYGLLYKCEKLESVTIGGAVTLIDEYAFTHCKQLKAVYFKGGEEAWNQIVIKQANDPVKEATKYFYSKSKPTAAGNYWHYAADGVTPEVWA